MDHFSSRQPIALPVTSEKEPLVAEVAAPPANPPTPPSRKSKFKKALKIFVHLFLIGVFLRWLFNAHFHKKWFHHHHSHPCKSQHGHHHGPPPEPAGVLNMLTADQSGLQCDTTAQWSDVEEISNNLYPGGPRFSSNTTFTFPLSSESLLLYAHGRYSTGRIFFVEDDTNTDDITVDINVHYWNKEALDQAQICTLNRAVGEGLGIFVRNIFFTCNNLLNFDWFR
jgi:hypothetical protein